MKQFGNGVLADLCREAVAISFLLLVLGGCGGTEPAVSSQSAKNSERRGAVHHSARADGSRAGDHDGADHSAAIAAANRQPWPTTTFIPRR